MEISNNDKIDIENNNNSILIVDTAADQCTCGGPTCKVLHDTGNKVQCNGYLRENEEGMILPLVTAITCVEIEGQEPILFIMNQACFYDCDAQNETLCHPYQAMEHGVTFCLTPVDTLTPDGNNGRQQMVVEDRVIPLNYDGRKMYLNIRQPTEEGIETLTFSK